MDPRAAYQLGSASCLWQYEQAGINCASGEVNCGKYCCPGAPDGSQSIKTTSECVLVLVRAASVCMHAYTCVSVRGRLS